MIKFKHTCLFRNTRKICKRETLHTYGIEYVGVRRIRKEWNKYVYWWCVLEGADLESLRLISQRIIMRKEENIWFMIIHSISQTFQLTNDEHGNFYYSYPSVYLLPLLRFLLIFFSAGMGLGYNRSSGYPSFSFPFFVN